MTLSNLSIRSAFNSNISTASNTCVARMLLFFLLMATGLMVFNSSANSEYNIR